MPLRRGGPDSERAAVIVPVLLEGWEADCCARGVKVGDRFGGVVFVIVSQSRPAPDDTPLGVRVRVGSSVQGVGRTTPLASGDHAVDLGNGFIAGSNGRPPAGVFQFDGTLTVVRHGPFPPELRWREGQVTAISRWPPIIERNRVVGHHEHVSIGSTPLSPGETNDDYLVEMDLVFE